MFVHSAVGGQKWSDDDDTRPHKTGVIGGYELFVMGAGN